MTWTAWFQSHPRLSLLFPRRIRALLEEAELRAFTNGYNAALRYAADLLVRELPSGEAQRVAAGLRVAARLPSHRFPFTKWSEIKRRKGA